MHHALTEVLVVVTDAVVDVLKSNLTGIEHGATHVARERESIPPVKEHHNHCHTPITP